MEWQRTFEYAAPVDEVWQAFYETDEPQVWNNPIKGDAYLARGSVEVEISELEPGRLVRWSETEGDDRIEMTVSLEAIETGTRLTLTRSGFGSGDAWVDLATARLLGWEDALHDLGVFLEWTDDAANSRVEERLRGVADGGTGRAAGRCRGRGWVRRSSGPPNGRPGDPDRRSTGVPAIRSVVRTADVPPGRRGLDRLCPRRARVER